MMVLPLEEARTDELKERSATEMPPKVQHKLATGVVVQNATTAAVRQGLTKSARCWRHYEIAL